MSKSTLPLGLCKVAGWRLSTTRAERAEIMRQSLEDIQARKKYGSRQVYSWSQMLDDMREILNRLPSPQPRYKGIQIA
jgi:hypothetical protein